MSNTYAMKNICLFLILTILSASCSFTAEQIFLIPVDTSTPAPTPTKTYTPVPTSTPLTPTLTFTMTPTLVGLKTATSTPENTPTVAKTGTPLPTITLNTPTPTVQMDGFVSVLVSSNVFYKGIKCEPASVKFTVQVAESNQAAYVVLFVRFRSRNSGSISDWTSIDMQNSGAGTFVHELSSDEMKGNALFIDPWVEYQLVAVTANAREIGRTEIFKETLSMLACTSTPTPLATGVKP